MGQGSGIWDSPKVFGIRNGRWEWLSAEMAPARHGMGLCEGAQLGFVGLKMFGQHWMAVTLSLVCRVCAGRPGRLGWLGFGM